MTDTPVAVLARQAVALSDRVPCRHEDPQLWFSDSPADATRAQEFCRGCPLRLPCLAGAVERGEPWGVWGGEVFANGVIIGRKRGRGRPRRHKPAA